jgi:hypothetical protein
MLMARLRPHPDRELLDRLMPAVQEFQALANKHGIGDIFQDNGGKLLQLVLTMDLVVSPGRAGSDATDRLGRDYELKSLNIDLSSSFTTNHHLNPTIITKYRSMGWLFAMYRGIELTTIYSMEPHKLEPLFTKWESEWHARGGKDLNNPKIPARFVMEHGALIYGDAPTRTGRRSSAGTKPPIDPFEAED